MMIRDKYRSFRAFGEPIDEFSVDQLMSKYENALLKDVPEEARIVLQQHAAQFDRGFDKDGPLGRVLMPWPVDTIGLPAHRELLVRRTQAERTRDLERLRAPFWNVSTHGSETLLRFNVSAQKDWGVLGTGISAKTLTGVLGVGLSAVGLGVVASALSLSTKKAPAPAASPSPIDMQRTAEQRAAQIRAGQSSGAGAAGAVGVVGGAGAGFLVGGPVGAVAGAAAGYFLGKKVGQAQAKK